MAKAACYAWENVRMRMALHACAQYLEIEPQAEVLARWAEDKTGQGTGSQRVARWQAMLQGLGHSDTVLRLLGRQGSSVQGLIDHPLWQALGFKHITRGDIRRWLPDTEMPVMRARRLVGLPCTAVLERMTWLLLWLRVTPPLDPLLRWLLYRAVRCEFPRLFHAPLWRAYRYELSRLLRDRLSALLDDQAWFDPAWYEAEQALDEVVRFWSLLRAWGFGTPLFRDESQWCLFCDVCDRVSKQRLHLVFKQLSLFNRECDSIFDFYTLRWLYQKLYRARHRPATRETASPVRRSARRRATPQVAEAGSRDGSGTAPDR
ncbi:hypothetical protein PGC34_20030 [Pseudomonas kribbensis]|uniref:hypothetical protein n=1 Tax=Pseudomonas kribbensis TaxID=1628086 RepID=UPI003BF802A3